jgi:predicted dehydrogenase
MNGERPLRVTAVTHQFKPDVYPRVDDDATIVVSYPHAEGVIQASWNWPIGRKDMDIYGMEGQIEVADRKTLRMHMRGGEVQDLKPAALAPPLNEPVAYFAAVVRGEVAVHPLSSLETNMIVTEILDAARESARTGRSVELPAQKSGSPRP